MERYFLRNEQPLPPPDKLAILDIHDLFFQQNKSNYYNRLDIIVRYLAIENFYGKNVDGFLLYRKMQIARIGESRGAGSIDRFKQLISSYDKNGYNRESEIFLDTNLNLIDGSHRIALGLYHKTYSISCCIKPHATDIYYGINWFIENGFTKEEILKIKNKYNEVSNKISEPFICTLWPPVQDYFDEITELLKISHTVIKYQDYTYDDYTFNSIVKGIYAVDDIEDWKIKKKIESMQSSSDKKRIRVIELGIDRPQYRLKDLNNQPLSIECESIKRIYRNAYKGKVDNYFHDIIMHIGDNYRHNSHIKELFNTKIDLINCLEGLANLDSICLINNPKNADEYTFTHANIFCIYNNIKDVTNYILEYLQNLNKYKINVCEEEFDSRKIIEIRMNLNDYTLLTFHVIEYPFIPSFKGFLNRLSLPNRIIENKKINYLDSKIEFNYLSQFADSLSSNFVRRINEFKLICQENNISLKDTCIVGSSSLNFIGLRDAKDLDFIATSNLRKKHGDLVKSFSENIELVSINWAKNKYDILLTDEDIITNDKYHFVWNNCKFVNIDLLYERKLSQRRFKDICDAKALELYYSLYYN